MENTEFFKASEFNCSCCDANLMHQDFVNKLDIARRVAGVPFKITSGYRCKKHNSEVGGVKDSSHTLGWAVDISCTNGPTRWKIINGLTQAGFERFGISKSFIHVDMDPTKPSPTVWLY